MLGYTTETKGRAGGQAAHGVLITRNLSITSLDIKPFTDFMIVPIVDV